MEASQLRMMYRDSLTGLLNHVGTKERAADPMKIWFAMWADETIDLESAIKRFEANEMEAVQELIGSP